MRESLRWTCSTHVLCWLLTHIVPTQTDPGYVELGLILMWHLISHSPGLYYVPSPTPCFLSSSAPSRERNRFALICGALLNHLCLEMQEDTILKTWVSGTSYTNYDSMYWNEGSLLNSGGVMRRWGCGGRLNLDKGNWQRWAKLSRGGKLDSGHSHGGQPEPTLGFQHPEGDWWKCMLEEPNIQILCLGGIIRPVWWNLWARWWVVRTPLYSDLLWPYDLTLYFSKVWGWGRLWLIQWGTW